MRTRGIIVKYTWIVLNDRYFLSASSALNGVTLWLQHELPKSLVTVKRLSINQSFKWRQLSGITSISTNDIIFKGWFGSSKVEKIGKNKGSKVLYLSQTDNIKQASRKSRFM